MLKHKDRTVCRLQLSRRRLALPCNIYPKVMPLNSSIAPIIFDDNSRMPRRRLETVTQSTDSFHGYASLFGAEDQGRDVVMPGAFRASLAKRPARHVRMLFQHDPAQPIGIWDEIREDARGLFVRGHLIGGVARAREILALMQGGALDGLSIGFRTKKAVRDAKTGQRRLYEIDLWEISVVTFPMLPGARIDTFKSRATAAFPLTRPRPQPAAPLLAESADASRLSAIRLRMAAGPAG